jgi:hypothetical protein
MDDLEMFLKLLTSDIPEQRIEMEEGKINECSMCGITGKGIKFAPYTLSTGQKHNLCEYCLGIMEM